MKKSLFGILVLVGGVLITGCATTGIKEKVTIETLHQSELFQSYLESEYLRAECRQYALEVDEHLGVLDGNLVEPENLRISIIKSITMSSEYDHPIKGLWRLTFDVRTDKGIHTYNSLNKAIKGQAPDVFLLVMGGTLTDPALQPDIAYPILIAAMVESKNRYPDHEEDSKIPSFVLDTKVISGPDSISEYGKISGPWTEEWTVRFYFSQPPVPIYIDFSPASDGGTNFKIYTDSQEDITIIF